MIDYKDANDLLLKATVGDEEAKNKFVEENMGLVYLVAKRFNKNNQDMEDIIQIGTIGLFKAMNNFDFSYNVKFSTYAVPMIAGEIKRFLRDDGMLKISRSLKSASAEIRKIAELFENENKRSPTIMELAKMTHYSNEEIIFALTGMEKVVSIFESTDRENEKLLVMDKLSDEKQSEDKIVDKIVLKDLIRELKPRERQIIFLRYFKEYTQERVAKMLGVSQVQICRLEKKILNNLRDKLR